MNQLTADQFSIHTFGHLGLVAATIDKLGLVDKIDKLIPCGNCAKTTIGQRVKAMILNGLGFIDYRLYMFPQFLEDKPIDRLFGENLSHELFNDDSLGRGLDKIAEYGVTKVFSTIAMAVGIEHNLLGRNINADTTTLSLYGEYPKDTDEQSSKEQHTSANADKTSEAEGNSEEDDTLEYESEMDPWPTYGYAKNKRHDLKQMVLNLATTGKAGMPVWFEAHSGNASDKKILLPVGKKVNELYKSLKDAPEFLVVGDSAMYDACLKEGGATLWLTRVPESHGIARDIVQKPESAFAWTELGNGYKASYQTVTYKKIEQRWAIVFSQAAYDREIITLNKKIKADFEETQKGLWHLSNKVFGCAEDANQNLKQFRKKLKYHEVTATVETVTQHKASGRPKKGAAPEATEYKIVGNVTENKTKSDQMRNRKGRFILATNQLDKNALPDDAILKEYKEQSKTESGFKFIKDNTFEVSAVFLKKPERIAALMMIMVLSLMVYAFVQYHIRSKLQEAKETIPDQRKKATDKPTASWIFRILNRISIVRVRTENAVQEFVGNLDELRIKIIRLFGPEAMKIYGVP